MARPRYRALSKIFLAPDLVLAGTVFDWDGPPSIHMEPLNEEAVKVVTDYFANKPWASKDPLEHLPKKIDPKDALNPGLTVISPPPKETGTEPSLTNPGSVNTIPGPVKT